MTDINVTCLVEDVSPFDLSHSIAEGGKNAGPETWAASLQAAREHPVLAIEDYDDVRKYFKGFGAWEEAEINLWDKDQINAMVLQYAAGDLREVQSLCPGPGVADVDWDEAERLSSEGTIGGHLYEADGKLWISLCD